MLLQWRVHFFEDLNMEKKKCSPNVKRKTSCTLASYSTSVTNTVFSLWTFFICPPPLHIGNTTVFAA